MSIHQFHVITFTDTETVPMFPLSPLPDQHFWQIRTGVSGHRHLPLSI